MSKPFLVLKPGNYIDRSGATFDATEELLREVAANYEPALHNAPLCKGHPRHDDPAYGWTASLSFTDGALYASPEKVDEAFRDEVNSGRFPYRSPAFYAPTSPDNPTPGKWQLRHVGFLGAMPPAAKGLGMVRLSEDENGVIELREFTPKERKKLAKSGVAMPDGSYPINTRQDVINAVRDYYRTGKDAAVKAHIVKRAKALGCTDALPEAWTKGHTMSEFDDESESDATKSFFQRFVNFVRGDKTVAQAIGEVASPAFSEGEAMTEQEKAALAAERKELTDKGAALRAKIAELSERETKLKEREKSAAAKEAEGKKAAALQFAEGLVKAGKVLPREKASIVELLVRSLDAPAIELSEGEGAEAKKVQKPANVVLRDFLNGLPKRIEFAEVAGGTGTLEFSAPDAITRAAIEYQDKEAKAGRTVTASQAVTHVAKGK